MVTIARNHGFNFLAEMLHNLQTHGDETNINLPDPVTGIPAISSAVRLYEKVSTEITLNIIETLLQREADVEAKDDYDSTPLESVTYKEGVRLLCAYGANVHHVNWEGLSLLHVAAMHDQQEKLEVLIEHGADVNTTATQHPYKGNTPLHYAAQYGKKGALSTLLQAGADPTKKNFYGKTPYDECRESEILYNDLYEGTKKQVEIIRLLQLLPPTLQSVTEEMSS